MAEPTLEHKAAHEVIDSSNPDLGGDALGKLMVHMARFHGWTESNVEPQLMVHGLLWDHDQAHGARRTPTLPTLLEVVHQEIVRRANGREYWWPWTKRR